MKKALYAEMDGPPTLLDTVMYQEENPFRFIAPKKVAQYDTELATRVGAVNDAQYESTAADIVAARAVLYSENEAPEFEAVAQNVVKASSYEVMTKEIGQIQQMDREQVIQELEVGLDDSDKPAFEAAASKLLTRLYSSFTRRELGAIVDVEAKAPNINVLTGRDRAAINKTIGSIAHSSAGPQVPRHSGLRSRILTPSLSMTGPSMF